MSIAKTHLYSAYAVFVRGALHKWNYVMCTVDLVGSLFQPLEDTIHEHLIPALTGRDPYSDHELEGNYLLCLVDLVV